MNNDTIIAIAQKTNDLINLLKNVRDENTRLDTKSKLIEERNKEIVSKQDKLSKEQHELNATKEQFRLQQEDFEKSYQTFLNDRQLLSKRQESFDLVSKELITKKTELDKELAKVEIKKQELSDLWEKEKQVKDEWVKIESAKRENTKEKEINREHKEMLDRREQTLTVKEARINKILQV